MASRHPCLCLRSAANQSRGRPPFSESVREILKGPLLEASLLRKADIHAIRLPLRLTGRAWNAEATTTTKPCLGSALGAETGPLRFFTAGVCDNYTSHFVTDLPVHVRSSDRETRRPTSRLIPCGGETTRRRRHRRPLPDAGFGWTVCCCCCYSNRLPPSSKDLTPGEAPQRLALETFGLQRTSAATFVEELPGREYLGPGLPVQNSRSQREGRRSYPRDTAVKEVCSGWWSPR